MVERSCFLGGILKEVGFLERRANKAPNVHHTFKGTKGRLTGKELWSKLVHESLRIMDTKPRSIGRPRNNFFVALIVGILEEFVKFVGEITKGCMFS
jgi:hypothetical protein